jgi:hypothetical protein
MRSVVACILLLFSCDMIIEAWYSLNASYHSNLMNSAFCKPRSFYRNRNHPTDLPEHHLPWIWEAVLDPVQKVVEISTLSRVSCQFQHDQWKDLLALFPSYRHQLGYGLDSNILVPIDLPWTIPSYFNDKYIWCEYFHDDELVYSKYSRRIRGKQPFSYLGSYQIRCPLPEISIWNRLRLQLLPLHDQFPNNSFSNVTIAVSPCQLPTYNPNAKKYKLAICTATNRAHSRIENLVEWLEYHRIAGVDHVYLYDTSIADERGASTHRIMQHYIDEGFLTIISWPFHSCVRNMAKGRFVLYRNESDNSTVLHKEFRPPKPITQYAALASCYTRFKHTSKYIVYIDDDEYLVYSANALAAKYSLQRPPRSLVEVADLLFDRHPRAPAIRFEPIIFLPCNATTHVEYLSSQVFEYDNKSTLAEYFPTPLPRLGTWSLSKRFLEYESKLIMRTDAVGMFYIHFVSMMEANSSKPWKIDHAVTLPMTMLTLFHFKKPASLSRNILEGKWPIAPNAFAKMCDAVRQRRLASGNRTYHAQIAESVREELRQRYEKLVLT